MKKKAVIIFFIISLISAQEYYSPEEKTGIFILVDNTPPIIIIHSPQERDYDNSHELLVNFTIIDPSLDTIWYSLNGEKNITIESYFYLSLPIGSYNIKIYANDTKNRRNFSETNFKISNSISEPNNIQSNSKGPIYSSSNSSIKNKNESHMQTPQDLENNNMDQESSSKNELEQNNLNQIKSSNYNENRSSIFESQEISLNYKLIFSLILISIILIIYKFINNIYKKQKWKKKK